MGDAWATILAYAVPRWGKTMLTRTARRPLVLACEMGAKRGLGTLQDLAIPYLPIDDMETLLQVARELGKNRDVCTFEGEEFETVILDSASVAGELGLEGAQKIKGWQGLWDTMGTGGKDPRMAYPYMNEKMRQLMKLLMNVQANFLAIARESMAEEKDTEGKIITYKVPEFPGQKLPHELPGWPDATLRGDIVNGQRLLRTRTHMRAVAGIRVPGLNVPEFLLPNTAILCDWMRTGDAKLLAQLTPQVGKPKAVAVTAAR
jgi:hypothetical protein